MQASESRCRIRREAQIKKIKTTTVSLDFDYNLIIFFLYLNFSQSLLSFVYARFTYHKRVHFGGEINLTVGGLPLEPPLIMSAHNMIPIVGARTD